MESTKNLRELLGLDKTDAQASELFSAKLRDKQSPRGKGRPKKDYPCLSAWKGRDEECLRVLRSTAKSTSAWFSRTAAVQELKRMGCTPSMITRLSGRSWSVVGRHTRAACWPSHILEFAESIKVPLATLNQAAMTTKWRELHVDAHPLKALSMPSLAEHLQSSTGKCFWSPSSPSDNKTNRTETHEKLSVELKRLTVERDSALAQANRDREHCEQLRQDLKSLRRKNDLVILQKALSTAESLTRDNKVLKAMAVANGVNLSIQTNFNPDHLWLIESVRQRFPCRAVSLSESGIYVECGGRERRDDLLLELAEAPRSRS